jgi:hypothetical protein
MATYTEFKGIYHPAPIDKTVASRESARQGLLSLPGA